jgi:putative nucleotidyltransferase with HDIG domain
MYTQAQKKLVSYTRVKVKKLMKEHPFRAHGFDHAQRVSKWAVIIAEAEKADVFLSELAGLLHDIGRAREELLGNTKRHHELSYEICQEWFREDTAFFILSKEQKLTILYSLRYHWNDVADKYQVAWILRDADKLDGFGKIGLRRSIETFKNVEADVVEDIRLHYQTFLELRTKKAKQIMKEKNLFAPLLNYYQKVLRSGIKAVEL